MSSTHKIDEFYGDEINKHIRFNDKRILQKTITGLLGVLEGIKLDGLINEKEKLYLDNWIVENEQWVDNPIINEIVKLVKESISEPVAS